eukprot:gb/GFBE01011595.1/.p1 GENE.gb/GFBE01011595.1/~~gb/GFBE01011595.1/.p1  ORF type:complete len:123 (+),score=10.76 gb/GFBE01011595.1/:1-369(+)
MLQQGCSVRPFVATLHLQHAELQTEGLRSCSRRQGRNALGLKSSACKPCQNLHASHYTAMGIKPSCCWPKALHSARGPAASLAGHVLDLALQHGVWYLSEVKDSLAALQRSNAIRLFRVVNK